jgi:hypothetical protein
VHLDQSPNRPRAWLDCTESAGIAARLLTEDDAGSENAKGPGAPSGGTGVSC